MFNQLRKYINSHPLAAGGLLVIGIALCLWLALSNRGSMHSTRLFFTKDDGKTWFVGAPRAAPFTEGGKEVYQAMVFACPDNGNQKFVGYLVKYSEKNKAAAEKAFHNNINGAPPPMEVKKPGDMKWITVNSPSFGPPGPGGPGESESHTTTDVRCPDGKYAILQTPR